MKPPRSRYVRHGHTDLAVASARAWHGLGVDSFDALIAPMTIDSFALQEAVLASPMAAQMLDGVAPLGLTGLAVLPGPLRRPVGVGKDLLAAADYRGAQIGISSSPVASRFFAELGARSTESGFFGESITGYDGIEQQVASVAGNRYDAVARSITANVALWPRPLVVVASTKALQKLTSAQRQVLRQAAARAVQPATQAQQSEESESIGILCRRGAVRFVSATPGDVATLQAAGDRVRDWLATDERDPRLPRPDRPTARQGRVRGQHRSSTLVRRHRARDRDRRPARPPHPARRHLDHAHQPPAAAGHRPRDRG